MSSKHHPSEVSSKQTRLLTAKQAAEYLGIRPKTFWEWTNKGVIPAVKIPGANPRYDLRDLEALIERHKCYPAVQGAKKRSSPGYENECRDSPGISRGALRR